MTVELDHAKLMRAAGSAEDLASSIRTNAAAARAASPVALPSLEGIEAKAEWLEEQADMLYGLADLAVLLDDSGQVGLPLGAIRDTLDEVLGSYLTSKFGSNLGFGDGDDFPLIEIALGLSSMRDMSQGVAPVFQTSAAGQRLLPRLAAGTGRTAQWAQWMLAGGGKHQGPPRSLLRPPRFTGPGSPYRTGGWGDPLAKGPKGGLALTRGLGVAGGLVSTANGAANLYRQGNPVEAFKRDKAGYVSDVASTTFSASSTAFLVAPNPVTGAVAVGSGLVWAGAEVVDHWDDISETASKGWDKVTSWLD